MSAPAKSDKLETAEIIRQISSLKAPNAHMAMPKKWRRILLEALMFDPKKFNTPEYVKQIVEAAKEGNATIVEVLLEEYGEP